MITGVRHVGIVVRDLDTSLHFYCDMLGLAPKSRMLEEGPYIDTILGLKAVKVTTIKLGPPQGGGTVELLSFSSHHDWDRHPLTAYTRGPTHVAFTVRDLDALYKTLSGNGVPFISRPCRSPDDLARVAFCRDPDGTLIELVELQEEDRTT